MFEKIMFFRYFFNFDEIWPHKTKMCWLLIINSKKILFKKRRKKLGFFHEDGDDFLKTLILDQVI